MGFFATENYKELCILVKMVTKDNMQLWIESDMMIDLWFAEYMQYFRDNIIISSGDFRFNLSWADLCF